MAALYFIIIIICLVGFLLYYNNKNELAKFNKSLIRDINKVIPPEQFPDIEYKRIVASYYEGQTSAASLPKQGWKGYLVNKDAYCGVGIKQYRVIWDNGSGWFQVGNVIFTNEPPLKKQLGIYDTGDKVRFIGESHFFEHGEEGEIIEKIDNGFLFGYRVKSLSKDRTIHYYEHLLEKI